jgi:putative proteasome-type protease
MTYCLAMNLSDGLVFASDSRTNAGTDYVTSYSKMHTFEPSTDRMFVLLSAGNLATTQEVINRIKRDLDFRDSNESLVSAGYMFEVADYIGRVTKEVQQNHGTALQQAGVSGEVTWILGGQIAGQPHSLMLIYPQGNYIEASVETPFLQIGETKYGKPVLDRVLNYQTSVEDAAKLALVSLTSTANSNITVGPPFELAIYRGGDFRIDKRCKFDANGDYLPTLERAWRDGLYQVFNDLPALNWSWNDNPQQMPLQAVTEMPVQSNPLELASMAINKTS